MSSQQRMQSYMERHRIQSLFEELMNKVVHDMPDDPVCFTIKQLCKKANIEVPQDVKLKASGARRPDHAKSQDFMSRTAPVSRMQTSSIDATTADREYTKPWLSNSKRIKPKRDESPSKTMSRKKVDWNNDNKVGAASFDDLWDNTGGKRSKSPTKIIPESNKNAWASIGIGGDDGVYSSGAYTGPRKRQNLKGEDLVAEEMIVTSNVRDEKDSHETLPTKSGKPVKGPGHDAKKHRANLGKLVSDNDKSSDEGYIDDTDTKDADAIELLEDANDLRREGVTNIPTTGYKVSRSFKKNYSDEPKVKLNINLQPFDKGGKFDDYTNNRDSRPASHKSDRGFPLDSEDEFESVSQVTGPRKPVWDVVESDGEIPTSKSANFSSRKISTRESSSRKPLSQSGPVSHDTKVTRSYESGAIGDIIPSKSWEQPFGDERDNESPPSYSERESQYTRSHAWKLPEEQDSSLSHIGPGKQARDYRAY